MIHLLGPVFLYKLMYIYRYIGYVTPQLFIQIMNKKHIYGINALHLHEMLFGKQKQWLGHPDWRSLKVFQHETSSDFVFKIRTCAFGIY